MTRTTHKITIGDARDMREVTDDSVQLIVTSPPYWQLKDYGSENQIGFNQTYEDYINHLNLAWAECHRVLEGGCRMCVNIGDQFARAVYYGRYKVIPIKTEIIKFCETIGFDYMGTIIWQKLATSNASGGGSVMGSFPYPRNGIVKIDYESILLFKKNAPAKKRIIDEATKQQSKLTNAEWNTYFAGHWNFAGVRQQKHLAMFPPELPNRLIKMFSFVGETVLDPFVGSGTTCMSAANLHRNSIGYEVNPAYQSVLRETMACADDLVNRADVDFACAAGTPLTAQALAQKIAGLPYRFTDTVKMERKVNPKTLSFGSKIDGDGSGLRKDRMYRVSRIINPTRLLLDDDIHVRLIGVRPATQPTDAESFLSRKTKGHKVFMKFDREKHDTDGNLLCYLYLDNKTFLNAHLIKHGFALPDERTPHRHQRLFAKYHAEAGNGK